MTQPAPRTRLIFLIPVFVVLSLISAFFVFYTARLLVVTHGLSSIRAGGGGAYVGAVVFPLLAIVSGWGAWRSLKALRGNSKQP